MAGRSRAHAVSEKEPQRGGFELQHGWPEPSARRKREGAAARRIRAAAWLAGAGAHAVSEKEPPRGGFEMQHGWPEPSAQAAGGKEFEKWDTG